MIKWLQETYGAEIYTFTADLGQEFADPSRFKEIEEKAYKLGAVKHFTVDLKEEFIKNYVFPTIKANGLYLRVPFLLRSFRIVLSSLARQTKCTPPIPLIAAISPFLIRFAVILNISSIETVVIRFLSLS